MQQPQKTILADLGYSVGKLSIRDDRPNNLVIVTPTCTDEHTHEPAQSITVHGLVALRALQKLLNDNLPKEETK